MNFTIAQNQINNMELFGGGAISNVCGYLLVDGQNNIDWLKEQVNKLFEINDALRIHLKKDEGMIQQYVETYQEQEITALHFSNMEEFYNYALEYAKDPLPSNSSLCEILLVIMPDKYGIMPKLHHVVGDAWAIALIGNQFNALLRGEVPPAFSFAEYIDQEKEYLSSKRYKKDEEFFINQMMKFDDPIYFSNIQTNKYDAKRKTFVLTEEQALEIKKYAEKNNTSVFAVFFSVWSAYLSKRNSCCEKLCIGTTVLNRNNYQEKNTVGLFVNTVPVIIDLDWGNSFLSHLENVETATFSALRHQRYNYQNALQKTGCDYQKPYDVLLSYQNTRITGSFLESIWLHNGMQLESLQVHIEDRDNIGILNVHYDYQTEKITEEDIESIHQQLMSLLCDAIGNPEKPLCELEYLTEEEKEKVVFSFNDTALEYPKDKGVYELFEKQAEKTPDKPAVVFKDKKLTYSQLNDKVSECADRLCTLNIKAKDIVAVHLERSHELIVFQLAILKIGAIFLPVDKRFPINRIQQMCDNCDVSLLISDELDRTSVDANVIQLNNFNLISPTNSAATITNMEDCYIIYTSGSTGVPKGCLLTGKGLLNFCLNNNTLETLNNIENPIFACVNSASFDYFIAETLLPLTNGFTTVVLDDTESTMQEDFLEVVAKNNINVIMTTPTRLKIYFNDKYNCSVLKNMACICTSGEPLTPELLEKMYKKSPEAQVYNPIGPSECSVWDMGGRLERADGLDIHIGKPIANAQIYIVDKFLNPTPIGVTGEICIAGDGVGSGYLNNSELTAEKFINNPFGEGKLYKTGDLAYWRTDGNICYVGRNDFQVKVRGLRIELGEIESELEKIDGVEQAVAIVRKDNQDHQFICAFYTGKEKEAKEIRAILNTKLPKYMVPHIFVHLEEMPLTSSGKISRNNLPEVDLNNISTETEYVAPETEEEKALAAAIEEVLGTERVSMEDNFFNVGGDSISAIYIVSVLEEMGYELHVADIMQSDTLAVIAKLMESTDIREIYDQYEVNGYIPFTPIMKAFLNEEKEIPKEFVHICTIAADCDEVTARKAINVLVSHHDMLRGRFVENGIEILPTEEGEAYSFKAVKTKEELEKSEDKEETLVNVTFCKEEGLIKINVHHFLIDLISWEVLIKDFNTIINQIKNGEKITLPAKTASFKLWNEKLTAYGETMPEKNRAYWEEVNNKLDNAKSFCSDEEVNEAEEYSYTFDKDISNKLVNEVNKAYGTRTNEVLLTALGLAAGKIAEGNVGFMVESHGRTELHKPIAVERTIGWFTSCYPVVVNNNENITEELINVKETMRRIPKNGVEYLLMTGKFHKNTDILFNFYKTSTAEGGEITFGGTSVFPGKINVNCFAIGGIVTVNISVPECKHRPQIGEELGRAFVTEIENIIDICTGTEEVVKTRSDFSDDTLIQSELDELMDLFN